ncbi:FecR family protein [Ferruginibacter sp.]|nr:FecR domain-containing protein [Ferruginibacter sp.]
MDQEPNQIEDLLTNESFLKYCAGDETQKMFWEKQLEENPVQYQQAMQAKKMYELIKAELTDIPFETENFRQLVKQQVEITRAVNIKEPVIVQMPVRRKKWMLPAAAAIALLIISGYLLFRQEKSKEIAEAKNKKELLINDAKPGGNKAVLTLADGSQIILDSAKDGMITEQGNVKVIKLNNGQLAYNNSGVQFKEIQYNMISTPKGGQYKIILSDGSEVWLNAASAIRYPAAFAGDQREVEISGEVYFEVAKNDKQPFIVKKMNDEATIKVLGTHFNVNAYDDESDMKVTLLEGSVKVAKGNNQNVLKPGQQAVLTSDSRLTTLNSVDLDEVMAWKNGKFDFGEKANIEDIMRQLARWYDLEVEYKGRVTQQFWGSISRNVNASQVFKMLEATGGVTFKMEGKKVIVMP